MDDGVLGAESGRAASPNSLRSFAATLSSTRSPSLSLWRAPSASLADDDIAPERLCSLPPSPGLSLVIWTVRDVRHRRVELRRRARRRPGTSHARSSSPPAVPTEAATTRSAHRPRPLPPLDHRHRRRRSAPWRTRPRPSGSPSTERSSTTSSCAPSFASAATASARAATPRSSSTRGRRGARRRSSASTASGRWPCGTRAPERLILSARPSWGTPALRRRARGPAVSPARSRPSSPTPLSTARSTRPGSTRCSRSGARWPHARCSPASASSAGPLRHR